MNKRPEVYRLCCYTRQKFLKTDLFRVVRRGSEVYFDKDQNMSGRGAYLQKDLKVIEEACKKHTLSRALKMDVSQDIYLELIQELAKERR